MNESSQLQ